ECSAPPIYMVTGSQAKRCLEFSIFNFQFSISFSFFAFRFAFCAYSTEGNGISSHSVAKYRKKYQLESRNVSMTSVSRLAFPPQCGQVVCTNSSILASGDVPSPFGFQSAT